MTVRPILFSGKAIERFWSLVDRRGKNECWPWLGTKNAKGYGRFHADGKSAMAHRVSMALDDRDVPEGMEAHHVCRNRACVNPSHLSAATHRLNLLSGATITAAAAARTHCPQGHPLSGDNVVIRRAKRSCRECARLRVRGQYRQTFSRRRRDKLTRAEFDEIKQRIRAGESHSVIAHAMTVSIATVSRVRNAEVNYGR